MSRKDLVALLIGNGPCPQGLSMVEAGGFQVVFDGRAKGLWQRTNRKSVLRGMVQRQRDLEHLNQLGTVLPVLPGTRLNPDDAPRLVAANVPLLTGLAKRLTGLAQYQITIHWQVEKAAQKFGWEDAAAQERGMTDLAGWLTDALAEVTEEQIELPREADVLWNAAVLLPATDEDKLTDALQSFDALWPEGFRIRQVGPSPAVSFASIGLRHIQPEAVRAARAALNVSPDIDLAGLAIARREALMSAPADGRSQLAEAARLVDAALRAVSDRFPQAYTWREGQSAIEDGRRKVA